MNKIKKFETGKLKLAAILFALASIVFIYYAFFQETISLNYLFLVLIFSLASIIAILAIKQNGIKKEEQADIEHLKRIGKRIELKFEDAIIKSNSWSTEMVEQAVSITDFDSSISSYNKTEINSLEFNFEYYGKPMTQVINIVVDAMNLKIKLGLSKSTTLYIDPKNSKNKIINIRFLMPSDYEGEDVYTSIL